MSGEDELTPEEVLRAAEPATIAYGLGMMALGAFLGLQGVARYLYPVPPTGWLDTVRAVMWWMLAVFAILLIAAVVVDQYRA
jgi:hypothetical protein